MFLNSRFTPLVLLLTAGLLGLTFSLLPSGKAEKKFLYDPIKWSPDIHASILLQLKDFGIPSTWIQEDKTERLIGRPVYRISIPVDFPFVDLHRELKPLAQQHKLIVSGFDNRQEKYTSLHWQDKKSVIASYRFHYTSRAKRSSSDIYPFIILPKENPVIPPAVLDRQFQLTVLLRMDPIKEAQGFAQILSKNRVDFGIYIENKGKLSIHHQQSEQANTANLERILKVFPFASVYVVEDSQAKFKSKNKKVVKANQILQGKSIGESKSFNDRISDSANQLFATLQVQPQLITDDFVNQTIKPLEKRGFKFRSYRDFQINNYTK